MSMKQREAEPWVLIATAPAHLRPLCEMLERGGYNTLSTADSREVLEIAASDQPTLILLDIVMPVLDGYQVCLQLKQQESTRHIPVLFVTEQDSDHEELLQGLRAGGVDGIVRPFEPEKVLTRVRTYLEMGQLARRNRVLERQVTRLAGTNEQLELANEWLKQANQQLQREFERREWAEAGRQQAEQTLEKVDAQLSLLSAQEASRWGIDAFVGRSRAVARILEDVRRLQDTGRTSVLITGESGTGKELIARAIHFGGARARKLFVPVNCSAIPGELAESSFFGHERGAFTGAHHRRKGYFELADGGTLFLDEIGDMPLELQAKLLRVLETGSVMPLGGSQEKQLDVRILAATNQDLAALIAAGRFREDLFFRLTGFTVTVPPLRERREDIAMLAGHFLQLFAVEMGKKPAAMSQEALEALVSYDFPGNVRELKNGDGHDDIVSRGSGRPLHYLQGIGDGTFLPDVPLTAAMTSPTDLTFADLNADGGLDIIVADNLNLKIFLRDTGTTNMALAFPTETVAYTTTIQLIAVVAADFDNDTDLDLATVEGHGPNYAKIFLNDGIGVVTPSSTSVNLGIWPAYGNLDAGDMNNDGNLDLVTGGAGLGELTALLGDGLGAMSAPIVSSYASALPPNHSLYVSSAALHDFTGDGILDVAIAQDRNQSVTKTSAPLVTMVGNGDGTFSNTQGFLINGGTGQSWKAINLKLADLNNDGNLDPYYQLIAGSIATQTYISGPPPPVDVAVGLPTITATYNQPITIPVSLDYSTDVVAGEVFIEYDTALLTVFSPPTSSLGTLTDGWTVETNTEPGVGTLETLKIAVATDQSGATGPQNLIDVKFTVNDVRTPASSPLTLAYVLLNANNPTNTPTSGSVTLVGNTATIDAVAPVDAGLDEPAGDPVTDQAVPRQLITVTVVDSDADLDGNPNTDQVTVTLANSPSGDSETLTLAEDATTAGTFSGTINTVFSTTYTAGDNLIQTQNGDGLLFTYSDALDAAGTGPNDRTDQIAVVGGSDGTVEISIASQPGDDVHIKVVDPDISNPPLAYFAAAPTISVDVANSNSPQTETVVLTETAALSGIFVGTLATTSGTVSGQMTSAEDDLLTVTYVDDLAADGAPQVDRTAVDQVLDPWGDADDNEQLQAFDAALTLLEVIFPTTISGLEELAVNVDLDPVGTGITPFDASLILQHRVGIINSFPVQDAASTNHPQPNPGSPKLAPQVRSLALRADNGYLSLWAEERDQILSGDLLIEGLEGKVVMSDELGDFLLASQSTDDGLRIVFAGAEAVTGPGELLRVFGVGPEGAQLTQALFNDGSIEGRTDGHLSARTPVGFALHANAPNPFNPETTIGFSLASSTPVQLEVFDMLGQKVRTLVSQTLPSGSHQAVWDGRSDAGIKAGSGVYLYRLQAGEFTQMRRMLLIK